MLYILQKYFCPPKLIGKLPNDIPELPKGDWKYSELLDGYVGHNLTEQENNELYWAKILRK